MLGRAQSAIGPVAAAAADDDDDDALTRTHAHTHTSRRNREAAKSRLQPERDAAAAASGSSILPLVPRRVQGALEPGQQHRQREGRLPIHRVKQELE